MLVNAQAKMTAHAGAQYLGRPRIGAAGRQEHRIATRSGRTAQDGAEIAGVLEVFQKHCPLAVRGCCRGRRDSDQRQQTIGCLEVGKLGEQGIIEHGAGNIRAACAQRPDLRIVQRAVVQQQMQRALTGSKEGLQQVRPVEQCLPRFAPCA